MLFFWYFFRPLLCIVIYTPFSCSNCCSKQQCRHCLETHKITLSLFKWKRGPSTTCGSLMYYFWPQKSSSFRRRGTGTIGPKKWPVSHGTGNSSNEANIIVITFVLCIFFSLFYSIRYIIYFKVLLIYSPLFKRSSQLQTVLLNDCAIIMSPHFVYSSPYKEV